MIIVPAELFSKWSWKAMRTIDGLWASVMIAEHREDGTIDVRFEHTIDACLSVVDVRS